LTVPTTSTSRAPSSPLGSLPYRVLGETVSPLDTSAAPQIVDRESRIWIERLSASGPDHELAMRQALAGVVHEPLRVPARGFVLCFRERAVHRVG